MRQAFSRGQDLLENACTFYTSKGDRNTVKVLAINGSARKNGNTDLLIGRIFEKLHAAGIQTEAMQFAGNTIQPCRACFACGGKENCVHQQDDFQSVFEKMKAADGILLGSPVYSANIAANMQAFLERAAVVCDMNPGLLKHKVGACFVTARRGGALNAVDAMNHFFLNHEIFISGSTYWNMVYGQMPGDVLNDEEGLATMDSLAENMLWLLEKIK